MASSSEQINQIDTFSIRLRRHINETAKETILIYPANLYVNCSTIKINPSFRLFPANGGEKIRVTHRVAPIRGGTCRNTGYAASLA